MNPDETQQNTETTGTSGQSALANAEIAAVAFIDFQTRISEIVETIGTSADYLELKVRVELVKQDIMLLRQRVDSMQGNVGADNPTFQDRSRKGQIEENT